VYELLFESKGDDSKPMLPGLIDVARLTYDEKKSGLEEEKSASGRPHVGGMSANGRVPPQSMLTGLGVHYAAAEA
jgi:hypothetical protein